MKQPIILGSASPRRKVLLKKLFPRFQIIPSNAKETAPNIESHKKAEYIALKKAGCVAKHVRKGIIIGADTIVLCKGRILGKPKNTKDALKMLKLLNGTWQTVCTGVAVINKGTMKVASGYAISLVLTDKLSVSRLKQLAKKNLDKAGAYAVQDRKDPFIRKIIGSKNNVIGLPLSLVKNLYNKTL
ncbi:Maf family protein [Elusimicrobiota bacterium]